MKKHDKMGLALLALFTACAPGGGPAPVAADMVMDKDMSGGADLGNADLSPGPDGADPGLGQLNEEFEGGVASARLLDLYPRLHDPLPLGGAAPGRLALTPIQVARTHWYSDSEGPLLYKSVTGDFVVETDVNIGRRDDMAQLPRGGFNAGGLLVRDVGSGPRAQRWIMYNMGHQTGAFAREAKTTRPGAGESLSTLYLIRVADGLMGGKLRICRIGGTFRFFHRHPGAAGWTEEAYGGGTSAMGNGNGEATPGVVVGGVIRFERPDMPATVQVGLMVGAWEAPLEVRAEFDYLRFGAAREVADCTAPLP